MLQFVQLSSFTNTTAFQPLRAWTPDGSTLNEQQKPVSEYVARCTIWVGPPAIPSSDGSKKPSGSIFDNITKIQDAPLTGPKSQIADVFVVTELACVVLSCSFTLDSGNGSSNSDAQRYFSLSMVFDLSLMSALQPVLYALSDRTNRLSRVFEHVISQAGQHSVDHYLTACDYVVKRAMDHTCRLLQPRASDLHDFSKTMFMAEPRDADFWEFLTLCTTSFLFTQRRAVVFSSEKSKEDEVNSIVRVLAALCSAEQLQFSSLLVPEQQFIPDMYLQGLDQMPLAEDLFECAHVVTLIDVDEKRVRRYITEAFDEKKDERIDTEANQIVERVSQKLASTYQSQKSDLDEQRLSSVSGKPDLNSDGSFSSPALAPRHLSFYNSGSAPGSPQQLAAADDVPDDAFYGGSHAVMEEEKEITDMDLPSEFIRQMTFRVLQAPPFFRQATLQQGLRVLLRWSMFLIAYLPKKLAGEDGFRNSHKSLKDMRLDLGIANEPDFHLFLYTADSCRPGFYSSMLHNPKAVGKLVLDLFESF